MKVIAFVGSPRKQGNTDILVDHFLRGATECGARGEKVYLYESNIHPCQGCYRNCWITASNCTRWDDDMEGLIEKMVASDLILFSSPVYMGTVTSRLIAFFERCIPVHHVDLEQKVIINNRLKGKNVVVALVHDSPLIETAELPFKVLEHVLTKSFQMNIVGKLQVPGVRDKGDINQKSEHLQEAYRLAQALCSTS